MQNFLILSIFVLMTTFNVQAAEQTMCDRSRVSGIYEGQIKSFDEYGEEETFLLSIKVEIGQAALKIANQNDLIRARIDIRCGTKVTPALYTVRCYDDRTVKLTLIDQGSSQCSLGNDPTLNFISGRLQINTGIRTPGFSGSYKFQRTSDLTWLY